MSSIETLQAFNILKTKLIGFDFSDREMNKVYYRNLKEAIERNYKCEVEAGKLKPCRSGCIFLKHYDPNHTHVLSTFQCEWLSNGFTSQRYPAYQIEENIDSICWALKVLYGEDDE